MFRTKPRAWRPILAVVVTLLCVLVLAACSPQPPAENGLVENGTNDVGQANGANGENDENDENGVTGENGENGEPEVELTYMLAQVAGGFARPVGIVDPGDGTGRLFVVEQNGRVSTVSNGEVLNQPFLDIRSQVTRAGTEQGLLSIAFHPDFATNGRVYVSYNARADGASIISRFLVAEDDANRLDPGTEQVILTVAQPRSYHNGGLIAFGPDGYLYIALGDGGESGHAQHSGTLLGALLRLDVDEGEASIQTLQELGFPVQPGPDETYAIPADNPWVAEEGFLGELWAIGLRNPWRFSFDRTTGDLWIADVGQNDFEEVNLQPHDSGGGENYGWPIWEGNEEHRPNVQSATGDDLVFPLATYPIRGRSECAVTGGYVYRGAALPDLQGRYLFGDYCSGQLWTLTQAPDGMWELAEFMATNLWISAFGEDADGELYVADLMGGGIYRLVGEPVSPAGE